MTARIVTIEDVPEIGDLLEIMLRHPEIEIHNAYNGEDGLALIHALQPDLIVLDIMLPGEMNGWTVYDIIRADATFKTTPVIVLSVLRQEADRREQFADSPIDVYMAKPFDAGPLRNTIAELLGRPRLWDVTG